MFTLIISGHAFVLWYNICIAHSFLVLHKWACFPKGSKASATEDGLVLPDQRVDQGIWLRSGFESPR